MSDEALLNMDEGTLRKLDVLLATSLAGFEKELDHVMQLEATLDLAERRRIRSAIRELCRQELEREEETLASKRSRTERSTKRQEDKENWLREEQRQQRSLDALSRKLESVQDVGELTSLLRGASEYEERKLIRAAIRKLRAEEIEAVTMAGKAYNTQRGSTVALASKGPEETTAGESHFQVQKRAEQGEIRAPVQEQPEATEASGPGSLGTLLLLDPVLSQPPLESPSALESRTEPASASDVPTGGSDEDDSGFDRRPSTSEEGGPGIPAVPEGSGVLSSSEGEALPAIMAEEHLDMGVATAGGESPLEDACQKGEIAPRAPETGAGAAERVGDAGLAVAPLGTPRPLKADCDAAARLAKPPEPNTEPGQEQTFQRAGSVRERARKLNAGTLNPSSAPPRGESAGRGPHVPLQPQPRPFQRVATVPLRDHGGSSSPAAPAPQDVSSSCVARTSGPQVKAGSVKLLAPAGPKEGGTPGGRNQGSQWQEKQLLSARPPLENIEGGPAGSEGLHGQSSISARSPLPSRAPRHDPDEMKTLLTIEIKDGRRQPLQSRVVAAPGNQRAELTLGLRPSPIRITASSHGGGGSTFKKMEAELPSQVALPNGTERERARSQEAQPPGRLSAEELSRIDEEDVLDKMLDQATDFEERRLIRAAMRDLRQRKRDQREKERNQRLQEAKMKGGTQATETTTRQSTTSADGSAISTVTKTQRLLQSNDGSKASRTLTMEASYVKRSENGNTFVQTKSYSSSSSKKVGSIFEREDASPGRGGGSSLAALERRQAEKRKELMKAQSVPKASASQARKAMIEKLEKEGGSPANPAISRVGVQRSSSFGVPNANSIKQMLLDWCRAKTRGYEHVDIQNFSSSWSNGMAFCALVHNFFPEAFDYAQLSPQDRRRNFEMAFSAAETHAECPQLLDVEDMVRMREPDWKCVYTYIQEFYRCLVQKGLVKTKKS